MGLVQFAAIGDAVGRLIDTIAEAFRPVPHATILAGALIIMPTVSGFLAAYLASRTWLYEMFNQFDGDIVSLVRNQVRQSVSTVQAEVDQVQEDHRSLRALLTVLDAQLDPREPEPGREALADVLAKATTGQREHAFRAAKRARRSAADDDLSLSRIVAAFEALIDVDPDRSSHHAELGVALADAGDYERSLATLDRAISLRGTSAPPGWMEFHRARARLALIGFDISSDPDTVSLVKDDLAVAWRNPGLRAHLIQVLAARNENDREYQILNRMLPYLPSEATTPA